MSAGSRSQPFCSPYGHGTRTAFSKAESGSAAASPPPERFALRQNAARAAPCAAKNRTALHISAQSRSVYFMSAIKALALLTTSLSLS